MFTSMANWEKYPQVFRWSQWRFGAPSKRWFYLSGHKWWNSLKALGIKFISFKVVWVMLRWYLMMMMMMMGISFCNMIVLFKTKTYKFVSAMFLGILCRCVALHKCQGPWQYQQIPCMIQHTNVMLYLHMYFLCLVVSSLYLMLTPTLGRFPIWLSIFFQVSQPSFVHRHVSLKESTLDLSLPGLRDLRSAVSDEQKRRQHEQQRLTERFQVGSHWKGLEVEWSGFWEWKCLLMTASRVQCG